MHSPVARGVGGGVEEVVGGGITGWNLLVWRGQLIKAPPRAKVPEYTGRHICTKKKTHI